MAPFVSCTSRFGRSSAETSRIVHEVDVVLGVESRGPQRDPLLGRVAGEIVLREVWPIVRRVGLRVEHRDAPGVAEPTEHFGGSVAGRAGADDDDVLRRALGRCGDARRVLLSLAFA